MRVRTQVDLLDMADADHRAAFLRTLAEVDEKGRQTALALFAAIHLIPTGAEVLADVINNLFAIVAPLPLLKRLLEDNSPFPGTGLGELSVCFETCQYALSKAESIVRDVDASIASTVESPVIPPGEIESIRNILCGCFHDMMVIISSARVERLESSSFERTDDDVRESRRLREALKQREWPQWPITPDSRLTPPGPVVINNPVNPFAPLSTPSQERDVLELQHPRGFRGRYGHPDYPWLHKKAAIQLQPADPVLHFEKSFEECELERYKLRQQGRYPNIAAFGIWPPTFIQPNSIQDYQLRPAITELVKNTEHERAVQKEGLALRSQFTSSGSNTYDTTASTVASLASEAVVNTPASTRDSTPTVDAEKDATASSFKPGSCESKTELAVQETSLKDASLALGTTAKPIGVTGNTSSDPADNCSDDTPSSTRKSAPKPTFSLFCPVSKDPSPLPSNLAPAHNSSAAAKASPSPFGLQAPSFGVTAAPSMFGGRCTLPQPPPKDWPPKIMEAYLLRPLCEDVQLGIEWTYDVKQLPLHEKGIRAHVRALGPDYSVIDALADLLPEHLRLIQIRVKNRHGHLRSVRLTRATDMVTKMGTFKVQSVIFVLETSHPSGLENDASAAPTNPPLGGLFGLPDQGNDSIFSGFGQNNSTGFRGFGQNNNTGFRGFGQNNNTGFRGFAKTTIQALERSAKTTIQALGRSAKTTIQALTGSAKTTIPALVSSVKIITLALGGSARITTRALAGSAKITIRALVGLAKITTLALAGSAKITIRALVDSAKVTMRIACSAVQAGITTKEGFLVVHLRTITILDSLSATRSTATLEDFLVN
ncbi:uncharacterized protein BDR25DRAFT_32172 [Lindgomyces ingoldianus]|uniref:Uncharacterized protein n=1 Tax=Lindgomyces ingoldianus TaxID=673940 RepID=A0ACB6QUN7_9PLEO|nr:uncharacterized protein BDR25DRAFT_32172 [Lindgomyces ingoldianus]KAF2470739.1 hypothetical protein BDR25DRAFT_32172 [Lindgomyces ingoldianus]